jgi:D-sedoheptulose 7-phosphate isomerase
MMTAAATPAWISDYLERQRATLTHLPIPAIARWIERLREAAGREATIFVAGNGGNAASAAHFATDLGKGASDVHAARFRVVCLADNVAWLTALGNDYDYSDVFVRQLMNFARPGDFLLTSSVSGNSPNLVKAVEWARTRGVTTLALVGARKGRLAALADDVIEIADTHYGRVEDAQMTIFHLLAYAFMEPLSQPPKPASPTQSTQS